MAARSLVRAVGAAQPRTVRPSIARAKPARARPTTTRAVPPLGVNLVVAELAESGLEKYSFLGLSVVIIGSVILRGTLMIRRLTAELEEMGFDLTNVEPRVGTLKYIKKEMAEGRPDVAREWVAAKQAGKHIAFGSGPGTWKKYYEERGVVFESIRDLDNVNAYLKDLREGTRVAGPTGVEVDEEKLMEELATEKEKNKKLREALGKEEEGEQAA